jgi:hypothetical protein
MTILNHANEGLYPELIVLARATALAGTVDTDELIAVCSTDNPGRLRGALSRWTALGFFHEEGAKISISAPHARSRGESIDDWTNRIPGICRLLALDKSKCYPLWGAEEGISADLARGLAWLLAQDIFTLPRPWTEIEILARTQVRGVTLFQNDTRWNALRFWARYLGFATGGSNAFFVDPTDAVRAELSSVLQGSASVDADTFVKELARRLPVFDGGIYRMDVEDQLDESVWRRPADGHLSMSLSFALRRLRLDGSLVFEAKSDAAHGYKFTGKDFTSGEAFTHVRGRRNAK